MTEQLPLDLDTRPMVLVGPFEYRRRDYTPKRKGEPAGLGWIRRDPSAEVGMEARILVDEIVRLRAELEEARSVPRETLDPISTQVLDSPDDEPANRTRTADHSTSAAGARAVAVRAGTQKHRLLIAYAETSGLTDEEAAAAARLPVSACWWKRCSELRDAGAIVDTGETRVGAAGVPRIVSSITDHGWVLLR